MVTARVFLVGCPRSGTTLLQSLVAAQPPVVSFPETHFFTRPSHSAFNRALLRRGLAPPAMRRQVRLWARQIKRDDLRLPLSAWTLRACVEGFVKILDTLAAEQNKPVWLEKTPHHLFFVEHWEYYRPDAKFIHLTRDGADNVAALYDVCQKHPAFLGVRIAPADLLDEVLRRWHEARSATVRHSHKPNHLLVSYENLARQPAPVLAKICAFIGIPFDESHLAHQAAVARGLVLPGETWKSGAQQPLHGAAPSKFHTVFDAAQQDYVRVQLGK